MKKLFYLIFISTLALPIAFTVFFIYYSNSFSVSTPDRSPYLKDTLGYLFPLLCSHSKDFNLESLVSNSDGCTFIYSGRGQYTNAEGTGSGYFIKKIDLSFDSYKESTLYLRYHVLYDWVNLPNKMPNEFGIISFNLSLTNNSMNEMIYSVNPYASYDKHLVEKIKERPYTPDLKENTFLFPSVLSFLTFDIFNIENVGGSISIGRKFPNFIVKDKNRAFIKAKHYFEEGELQIAQPGRFLAYSIANFTGFGVSDIYPRTSIMKVICAIETLLGMLLFGIWSAFAFEWILEKKKLVTKKNP